MGSQEERAKAVKKLVLNADENEEVLVEIRVRGVALISRLVSVSSFTGNSFSDEGYFTLQFSNNLITHKQK